jgi:hypothetical protein
MFLKEVFKLIIRNISAFMELNRFLLIILVSRTIAQFFQPNKFDSR